MMFPERVKLDIESEIDGFERTTTTRLLQSFNSIHDEAKKKSENYFNKRSAAFHPDYDDEGSVYEDTYFEEIYHLSIEEELKQEFLNSCTTWLFHLFERQKKRVYGTDKTDELKEILGKNNYDLSICKNWSILNKELRAAANSVKHGAESDAAKNLVKINANLIKDGKILVKQSDIQKYIDALRKFWKSALDNQIVL